MHKTKKSHFTWEPHTIGILIGFLIVITQFGCAYNGPSYSPLKGDRFRPESLEAKRVYVLASMDSGDAQKIGQTLSTKLAAKLQEHGFTAQNESQVRNPLALDSGINFVRMRAFAPDAIILIRTGNSSSSQYSSNWTITFDLLDKHAQGIWRGGLQWFQRGNLDPAKLDQFADSLSPELVENFRINKVLKNEGFR